MNRRIAVFAVGSVALLLGPIGAASAEPTTDTTGCQTVASKYTDPEAPGHQGVATAGDRTRGEGPCGFGEPPSGP